MFCGWLGFYLLEFYWIFEFLCCCIGFFCWFVVVWITTCICRGYFLKYGVDFWCFKLKQVYWYIIYRCVACEGVMGSCSYPSQAKMIHRRLLTDFRRLSLINLLIWVNMTVFLAYNDWCTISSKINEYKNKMRSKIQNQTSNSSIYKQRTRKLEKKIPFTQQMSKKDGEKKVF